MKRLIGTFRPETRYLTNGETELSRVIHVWYDNTFAIINRSIPDGTCRALADSLVIWNIDSKRKDFKGNEFYICSPAKVLSGVKNNADENVVVLFFYPFALYQMSGEEKKMFYRVAKQNGISADEDPEKIAARIVEMLVDGTLSVDTMLQQARTKVESDADTANLVLNGDSIWNRAFVGEAEVLFFRDLNNEGELIKVTSKNLDKWCRAIPETLSVTTRGDKLYLDIQVQNCDFWPQYDTLSRLQEFGNLEGEYSKKHIARPGYKFHCEKSAPSFKTLLDAVGLCEYEGQYVPKELCSWSLRGINLGKGESWMVPIHDKVKVTFTNGMRGSYPAIYLAKKYQEKPVGVKLEIVGQTLDTLAVRFTGI